MNDISNTIKNATKVVSPSWPLDSFVGVNPFWNLKDENFYKVLSRLSNINGKSLFLPINYYIGKYEDGVINDNDLQIAIEYISDFKIHYENDVKKFVRESLEESENVLNFGTYSDFISKIENSAAKEHIVNEITKYCASYFDLGQAPFSLKNAPKRLYSEWREVISFDKFFHHLGYKRQNLNILDIPETPEEMIKQCAENLNIKTEHNLQTYITKVCKHIIGWCSHIQYQLWQNNFGLNNNYRGTKIEDVIAIFMAYECLIKDSRPQFDNGWIKFLTQQEFLFQNKESQIDHIFKLRCIWQRAFELSYQRKLTQRIISKGFYSKKNQTNINVQMLFCIDVRSEVIRRKIEQTLPQISTHGFAGFFGVSIDCKHVAQDLPSYRCPVLLQPRISVSESLAESFEKKTIGVKSLEKFTNGLKQGLASSFAYVELFGVLSGIKILSRSRSNKNKSKHIFNNKFLKNSSLNENLDFVEKMDIAKFVLTHIGIKEFAKIVLVCGHGSVTTNNAFSSSLNCGACGGHAGDLNARFLCNILNNVDVRKKIIEEGKFALPLETIFIPAIHETVSDEIHILDKNSLDLESTQILSELHLGFQKATESAQQERSLISKNNFLKAAERSTNWSELRPEWALVNNACFIVAPRERSKNIDLEGRAFLHDYDYTQDEGMNTLELIMTAPMIVTNWINMQYYASAVEQSTFGSGNKMIQNIVGLFGVLEGNGGDLKIGLPFQSVHDGTRLIHEPLRLSVFIEAPYIEIEKIINNHLNVKNLVDNQWIHIFAIDRITKAIRYRRLSGTYEAIDRFFN